jgi:hypothetical protein
LSAWQLGGEVSPVPKCGIMVLIIGGFQRDEITRVDEH